MHKTIPNPIQHDIRHYFFRAILRGADRYMHSRNMRCSNSLRKSSCGNIPGIICFSDG